MKLWLLKPINPDVEPWEPWFDKAFGFVVRAESEEIARSLAAKLAGDEKSETWLDSMYASCEILTEEGKAEVILRDLASA